MNMCGGHRLSLLAVVPLLGLVAGGLGCSRTKTTQPANDGTVSNYGSTVPGAPAQPAVRSTYKSRAELDAEISRELVQWNNELGKLEAERRRVEDYLEGAKRYRQEADDNRQVTARAGQLAAADGWSQWALYYGNEVAKANQRLASLDAEIRQLKDDIKRATQLRDSK
jgi:hypothetical protein